MSLEIKSIKREELTTKNQRQTASPPKPRRISIRKINHATKNGGKRDKDKQPGKKEEK